MSLNTGVVLANRYRTVQLLGKGGFGAVYRGWDINLQLRCAIKENTEISEEGIQQFFREAQLLATLNHPNLPRVTDHFFVPDQGQYLVMDFIDGEDLETLLKRTGPIPEETLLPWIGQIVDALHYLHSQRPQVIHRDVKPANIRITPQGKAVLVDFGIAKVVDTGTMTAARAVTPGFSPPEQYMMTGTTAQSDIYSLGATLYTLLTGRVLPSGPRPQVLQQPSVVNSNISQRTSWLVMKALEAEPKNRFQSVLEIKRALNLPLSTEQNAAVPPVLPVEPPPTVNNVFAQVPPPATQQMYGYNAPQSVRSEAARSESGRSESARSHTPPRQAASRAGVQGNRKSNTSRILLIALIVFLILCVGTAAGGMMFYNAIYSRLSEATQVAGAGQQIGPNHEPTLAPELPAATMPAGAETTASTTAVEIRGEPAEKSSLLVEIRTAEREPLQDVSVSVYQQETDLNGSPVEGEYRGGGWTNDTGIYEAELEAGTYALRIGDALGLPLDPHYDYPVQPGQRTVVRITLGRVRIGIMDADGKPVQGKYTAVAFQQGDINGNPVIGQQFDAETTDARGLAEFSLFPGTYAVQINDLAGMPWGEETNHIVEAGKVREILVRLSRVVVGVVDADGRPRQGHTVALHYQQADIQGSPALGDALQWDYTSNTGTAAWDVTPGTYAITIGDIRGYPWTGVYNHTLAPGQAETVVLQLGRLVVEVKDGAGNPVNGESVLIYTQKADVNGSPTQDAWIDSGYTDNTGSVGFDLMPGAYLVKINAAVQVNVPVEGGKTTISDGVSARFR